MWKPTIALLWLATAASSSLLVPRYTNASCSAECTAFDVIKRYYWQKQEVTATITAATIVLIVDDRTNTTRTSTKTNELPADVTPPPTNAQGTHVTTIPVETAKGKTSQVVLAYPNGFEAYPISYGWYGTLSTTDAGGQGVCSTVNSELTTQWVDYSAYATPAQVTTGGSVDAADPKGYIYSLIGYGCYEGADSTINPDDAAPQSCSSFAMCGVSALSTALLLTDTSVSHETSTPETTPAAAPAQDTTPAAAQQAKQTTTAPAAGGNGNNNNNGGQQTTAAPAATPAPIVVGSSTITANSQSNFVIAGQTLTQGGQVVASGTTISLAQGGSIAVVNGATQSLVANNGAQPAALTVAGQTATANAAGQFVVGGSTLSVGGGAVTVGTGTSATVVSLTTNAAGQTVAVINGQSSTLAPGKTGGIGGAIASGLGATGGPEQFTGAGSRYGVPWFAAVIIPLAARLLWAVR